MFAIENHERKTTPDTNATPARILRKEVNEEKPPPAFSEFILLASTWLMVFFNAHWLVSIDIRIATILSVNDAQPKPSDQSEPHTGDFTTSFMNVTEIASAPPDRVITALSYDCEASYAAFSIRSRYAELSETESSVNTTRIVYR
jgi:hypothetical protein